MAKAYINSLNSDVISYLNDHANIAVRSESGRAAVVMLVAGLAIACLIGFLTYDYRWSTGKLVAMTCLILPASYLVIAGTWRLASIRFSPLVPGLIVTHDHGVFIRDGELEWFQLTDLVTADYRHKYNGRNYEFSTLMITFPESVGRYRVDGIELAESKVDEIEERKRNALVRTNRTGESAVRDVFDAVKVSSGKVHWRSLLPTAILTILVASCAALGAITLNSYFHDFLSWRTATETNTAASYRQYLRTNLAGRRRDEGSIRLKAFYDNAEARYKESLKPGFDQSAVDSILALLQYARNTHEYQVKVSFERTANIPPDLIEQLKADFEVKTVLPLGNTFTDERMIEREGQLFGVLQSSFKQIFPDDILELVHECPNECAGLKIRYATSFQDSIYYDVKEKDIPREDRNWSPGILIEWDCSLKIPSEPQSYSFELESAPADDIFYDTVETVGSDPKEAAQKSFYDAMVASSFDDFQAHFLFNLGLGPDPHPEKDTPTPKAESVTKVQ